MIIGVALAVVLAAPQDGSAQPFVAEGQAHYDAGNFAEAAAAFAEAHARDPSPDYLYRWAQAERRAGNCPAAVQLYRRYLDNELPPENVEAAEKNLARCGYAEAPPASTPLDESDANASAVPPPVDVEDRPRVWWADPLGTTLVAVGGAAVIAGVGLGIGSGRQTRLAREATVEEDYILHADRSESLRIAAIVTAAVGGALLVGGVVRWALLARGARTRRTTRPVSFVLRF
jgi:tetratricopeptide (TPR) repeat protein